jgi:hypothetical protein
MGMELEANDLARLRSQVSRGELILFTGAGFSIGAKDHSGRPIPSVSELKKELWQLLYPGEPYDAYSSIGDLYGAATRQKKADLTNLLQSRLTVRPENLPEYYGIDVLPQRDQVHARRLALLRNLQQLP